MTPTNTPTATTAETALPDSTVSNATALPDPDVSTIQVSEENTSAHEPSLTLWELMRKDVDPAPADETERVLSNPRTSVWER